MADPQDPEPRVLGHDPAALDARRRRQLRGQEGPVHPGHGRRQQALRLAGRHRDRGRQGGGAGRDREEGRGGARGGRAHREGGRAQGRLLHPLRPERGGAASRPTRTRWAPASSVRWRGSCASGSSPRSSRWRPRSSDGRMAIAHVRKGDTVVRDRGQGARQARARCCACSPTRAGWSSSSINMIKKHQRPTQKLRQGGIIEREGPLRLSNVLLVCSRVRQADARIGMKVLADGTKVRVCQRCGEVDRQGLGAMARARSADKPATAKAPAAARRRPAKAQRPQGRQGRARRRRPRQDAAQGHAARCPPRLQGALPRRR